MLSMQPGNIPPINVVSPMGAVMQVDIACHQASCYWIYTELNGRAPESWAWTDSNLSNSPGLMTKLARFGKLVSQTDMAGLANGTVLIFTDPTGIAKHSCILDNAGLIAGYNQIDWFTSAGVRHGYSTHNKTHIKWRAGKNNKIKQNNDAKGRLVAVSEITAINFARFNF